MVWRRFPSSAKGTRGRKHEKGYAFVRGLRAQGGGTLFSHIRRLGPFFGFKILNFNIFFGFQMNIFGGYEDFVDIFWGSSQNWASLKVISMQFRVFFKVKTQNWDIFLGC